MYNNIKINFGCLKPKASKNETYNEYIETIINLFTSLYDIDFGTSCIEKYPFILSIINSGTIGVTVKDNITYYGRIVWNGELDINGRMKPQSIITLNGKDIKSDKIVIFKLLPSGESTLLFQRFADRLTEVDISQRALIKTTRSKRIYRANSEKERKQIIEVIKDNSDGVATSIVNDISPFLSNDNSTSVIDLYDANKFQAMEYLSSYHSELLRRLYGLYGFSMQGKNKQAQVTTDELDDMELPSVLMPLLNLKCLEDSIKELNETHNLNWSIKASKILQRVLDDVFVENNPIIKEV